MSIKSVLHKLIDEVGNEADREFRHHELEEADDPKPETKPEDDTPKGGE